MWTEGWIWPVHTELDWDHGSDEQKKLTSRTVK